MASDTFIELPNRPLYTPEERARRDATIWTLVQGVLAPVQFVVFLISAILVARVLLWDVGYVAATASIIDEVGCDNVEIRCEATDVDYILRRASDGAHDMTLTHACLRKKCLP